MTFSIEPVYTGRTCVVVGSGPSLTAAQLHLVGMARLEDKVRVSAINDAVYVAWWADWLHAADHKWWHWSWTRVQHFRGVKTTLADSLPSAWGVKTLRLTGVEGFDEDPSCVRSGQTSGYQQVHNLLHAGARRIVLLGIDMKGNGEHFHRPHPDKSGPGWLVSADHFSGLVEPAKRRGCEILNCSPGSAVKAFPHCADLVWALGL